MVDFFFVRVHVCVCTWVGVYMRVYVGVCMCACVRECERVYMHVWVRECKRAYVYMYMCICMYKCACVRANERTVCECAYVYECIHHLPTCITCPVHPHVRCTRKSTSITKGREQQDSRAALSWILKLSIKYERARPLKPPDTG